MTVTLVFATRSTTTLPVVGFFRRFRSRQSSAAQQTRCSCGALLDSIDMNYGFGLPDEVFDLSPEERESRIRGISRVFVLDRERGFVRTLLPVELDHGSLTLGVWLEIDPRQAVEAISAWELPGYLGLSFDGVVANNLESWGSALHRAHAFAQPRSQDELPRVVDGDAVIRSYLTRTWPREELLIGLPELGHSH